MSSLIAISTVLVGVNSLALQPTEAVEIASRQRAFVRAPRLVSAAASFRHRNTSTATYKFTIEVPENAVTMLAKEINGLYVQVSNYVKDQCSYI